MSLGHGDAGRGDAAVVVAVAVCVGVRVGVRVRVRGCLRRTMRMAEAQTLAQDERLRAAFFSVGVWWGERRLDDGRNCMR